MSGIFDILNSSLGKEAVSQIAKQVGIDENIAKSAISMAGPMIVSQLGKNASTQEGAQSLNQALAKDHDGSILNNLGSVLSNPAILSAGSAILGHVFGSKQTNVNSALGQATGINSGQAGQIFEMLAPIVMGYLGKQKQENNLNANDLTQVLGTQRQKANSQLGGLASLIDMDGDGDITDDLMDIGGKLLGNFFKK